jgi:flagellar protein FliS
MFGLMNNPSAAYRKAGVETQVSTATPHELVLMLYDGALKSITLASLYMKEKNVAQKGIAIGKAIDIIDSGLKACLDNKAGGDLADKLGALYEYMCHRLLHANLRDDQGALEEVSHLLKELKSAWEEIADDPAVLSRNKVAA